LTQIDHRFKSDSPADATCFVFFETHKDKLPDLLDNRLLTPVNEFLLALAVQTWFARVGRNFMTLFGMSKWAIFGLMIGLSASADQMTVYPAQGQTPQQQEIDKAACQDFAKSQTGFDPQQALSQAGTAAPQTPPPAIRARKRAREEQAELSQENQQKAQMQKKLEAYNKAEAVCLKGKGYSVG
jgi:hypothetical protein